MSDTDIQVLRNRHFAIMDAMVAHPEWTQKEIAEALNYSEKYLGEIVRSSLFQTAFREYRQKFVKTLHKAIVDATLDAIKVSQEIIKDKGTPVALRQVSVGQIFEQGHAKAVEKKASLSLNAEIPMELLERMSAFMDEAKQPLVQKKLMERPDEAEAGAED